VQYGNTTEKLTTAYGDGFTVCGKSSDIYSVLVHSTPIRTILVLYPIIDLKTDKVDYQDADTDEDVARYSSLHDDDQLYMAKYLTYMPTNEELRREIEQQKMVFDLKSGK